MLVPSGAVPAPNAGPSAAHRMHARAACARATAAASRSGPSRPGDGGTADNVTPALEHAAIPGRAWRAATSLPIDVRPPSRHSSGRCHWALAGTRRSKAASGAHATRGSSQPSRGAPPRRRRRARLGRAQAGPLAPGPLPTPVAWYPQRRHARSERAPLSRIRSPFKKKRR